MLDEPDRLLIDVSILMSWKNKSKDTVLNRTLLKLSLINKVINEGWAQLYPIWSKNIKLKRSSFELTFDSRLRSMVKLEFLTPAGRSYTRKSIYGKYKLAKQFTTDEWEIIENVYLTIPSKWVKTDKDIFDILTK